MSSDIQRLIKELRLSRISAKQSDRVQTTLDIAPLVEELRLARMQPRILDPESQGIFGIAKRWGLLVTLLLGIVNFAWLTKTAWSGFHPLPQAIAYTGSQFDLSYDPAVKSVTFGFNISFSNQGNADDVIKGVRGELYEIDPNSHKEMKSVYLTDFSFSDRDSGRELFTRFSLPSSKSRDARMRIEYPVADFGSDDIVNTGGQRAIKVHFTTTQPSGLQLELCYSTTTPLVQTIFSSQSKVSRNLAFNPCVE
jgi:hypothetical protein